MGDHQKRLTAPEPWGIGKKVYKFITKTAPGPHSAQALPLAVWMRDQMEYAQNMKEVQKILNDKQVILNGQICKDPRRGIGLFDVISMPGLQKHFLILRDNRGKIVAKEVPADQARTRLCKVKGKTITPGGRIQLNLRFGANLLVEDHTVKPGDSVIVTLGDPQDAAAPRLTVVDHYPFATGNYAMVIGGKHRGRIGKIVGIERRPGSISTQVRLEDETEKALFDTVERYVFVVGKTREAATRWEVGA
ncbi:MAG: 30S ribosomal protein S4e [Methanomicrobiales archaeon]|nr:30S ribosomal protein S4e [Methanomicrobiales archaeon]